MAVALRVEQVAMQVQEKWRQSGWVSARKQGQKTVRGPRVWGGLARCDRGFEGNSRAQIAGFFATVAVGPRIWSEQARSRLRVSG